MCLLSSRRYFRKRQVINPFRGGFGNGRNTFFCNVLLNLAEETGQLFVGDAIVEVNGIAVEGKTHDEVFVLFCRSDAAINKTLIGLFRWLIYWRAALTKWCSEYDTSHTWCPTWSERETYNLQIISIPLTPDLCFFSGRQCLFNREGVVAHWTNYTNQIPGRFVWTFTHKGTLKLASNFRHFFRAGV